MDTARDGSLNRHGGVPSGQYATGESNADERARERAEAVEERALDILTEHACWWCPECEGYTTWQSDHLATCELLRARAESEVDAAERAR